MTDFQPNTPCDIEGGKRKDHSSALTSDEIVTIDGIQAKVSDMVKANILAVDSDGNYYRPEEYPENRNGEQQSKDTQSHTPKNTKQVGVNNG